MHGVADLFGLTWRQENMQISQCIRHPFFPAKPKLVFKGGFIAWSIMGDPNASLPTPEPVFIDLCVEHSERP